MVLKMLKSTGIPPLVVIQNFQRHILLKVEVFEGLKPRAQILTEPPG